ncbi:probable cytochrome P450 4aa1, partial [Thrips palmi]|uniref:Probable cytochrome P450 4aa1 n=1 Tax=Thrips palmi TaxID=161013 RepID=A0A6P8Z0T0_THRPL
ALVRAALSYAEFRKLELAIPGPFSLPVLGNALTFATVTQNNILETCLRVIGGRRELCRMSLFNHLVVVASDPEDIAQVLKRKEFNDKAQFFYGFIRAIAAKGLLQINGPDWKVHRSALEPALAKDVIERYIDVFSEEADRFSKSIPREVLDVHKALALPLVRIFTRTSMMTDDLDSADEQRLRDSVQLLDQCLAAVNARSFSPWLWPDFVFNRTSMGRSLKRQLANMREYVDASIVQRRLQAVRDAKVCDVALARKQILLDKMLQSEAFSDQDMMDEIVTFLSGSTDTSIATLSFAFKMMSISPEIQDRVRAEVDDVLGVGADARCVDLHDLPRLQYVEQVIRETMRILPPSPFLARQVYQQTELAGKTIPANSTLVVNIHGAHHDPEHWPDPWRFEPERFADFAPGKSHHPCAFMPFSAGPRRCPASLYAMMSLKIMFATVMRDHVVEPVDDGIREAKDFKLTFNVTARIVGGTWVRFRPRSSLAG